MKFNSIIASALIGVSVALVQPQIALALSSGEVGKIAQGFTVLIDSKNPGSGIIIKKQGNTYTVLTAAHVVDDSKLKYEIVTNDGKRYLVKDSTVKILPGVDLAVLQFTSNIDYPTAKIGNSDSVELGTTAYVAGFPAPTLGIKQTIYTFTRGEINANASRPLSGGYALVYSSNTLKGMSGGPVVNDKGELIGIHGRGDRDTNQDKTGRNLGIPINTFVRVSKKNNIDLGVRPPENPARTINASDFYVQGKDKSDKRDYQGAIAAFTEAIRLNPNYTDAYNFRGYARRKLGDYQGAIEDFNQASRINPNDADAYLHRGNARYDLKDYQGAVEDYNQALRINPNYAKGYNNRGNARQRLKDYQRAVEDYNQVIRINPNDAYVYNNRGVLRSKLKDHQGAVEDYNQAIRINPNYADAYYNRGNARYYLKDYQGAIEDYNQVIRINPNYTDAYLHRGNARYRLKDYQGAVEDYNQAIRINPNDADTYYNRGNLRGTLGDYQRAIEDYNKAIRINLNYVYAYRNRGYVRSKLGDYQRAIEDLRRAANLYQEQGDTQSYQRTLNLIQKIQRQL